MISFYSRYDSISKMKELICILFDNLLLLNSHQIILEIINGNPIINLIFDSKLYLLFFKDRLNSLIQNLRPITVKLLPYVIYIKWWLTIYRHIFVGMSKTYSIFGRSIIFCKAWIRAFSQLVPIILGYEIFPSW